MMNRPSMPKYVTRSNYTIELEKYCDQLENALIKANEIISYYQDSSFERTMRKIVQMNQKIKDGTIEDESN